MIVVQALEVRPQDLDLHLMRSWGQDRGRHDQGLHDRAGLPAAAVQVARPHLPTVDHLAAGPGVAVPQVAASLGPGPPDDELAAVDAQTMRARDELVLRPGIGRVAGAEHPQPRPRQPFGDLDGRGDRGALGGDRRLVDQRADEVRAAIAGARVAVLQLHANLPPGIRDGAQRQPQRPPPVQQRGEHRHILSKGAGSAEPRHEPHELDRSGRSIRHDHAQAAEARPDVLGTDLASILDHDGPSGHHRLDPAGVALVVGGGRKGDGGLDHLPAVAHQIPVTDVRGVQSRIKVDPRAVEDRHVPVARRGGAGGEEQQGGDQGSPHGATRRG